MSDEEFLGQSERVRWEAYVNKLTELKATGAIVTQEYSDLIAKQYNVVGAKFDSVETSGRINSKPLNSPDTSTFGRSPQKGKGGF